MEKYLFQDAPHKVKMCTHWHIKGDCYYRCSRAISHVTQENIPNDKKESFLAFMAGCREECKKNRSWLDSSGRGLAASNHQEHHPNFLSPLLSAPRLQMIRKSLLPNQHRDPFSFHPNNIMSFQLPTFQTLGNTSALLDINQKSRKHVRTQF
jgi:hypothetical protein